jgi:hypothetical protein
VGADLDLASQTLPIPFMVFAQDDALASEPDTACDFMPGCREELERAANEAENGEDEDVKGGDDGGDKGADEDDGDNGDE